MGASAFSYAKVHLSRESNLKIVTDAIVAGAER